MSSGASLSGAPWWTRVQSVMWCGRGRFCWRPWGSRTRRSPSGLAGRARCSRRGADGSARKGCRGLRSGHGRGRPRRFSRRRGWPRAACELPVERGVSLSRWSSAVLAREAITRGIVATVAAITVWRWLREGAIRPWSYRSWMFPREAKFAEKAGPGPVRGPVGGAAAGARRCRGVRMRGRRSGPARARIPVNLPRVAGKASWSSTSISARGCALLLGRVGCAPSRAV